MPHIKESDVYNATIDTSFASGNGLAMRTIMLDAIQRYQETGNKENLSAQDKKSLIIKLTKEAAHEAKDDVSIGYGFIKIFNLTLTPAQKELTARAYEKFFESRDTEQLARFLDDGKLISIIKKMPPIKGSDAKELTEAASKIAKSAQNGNSPDLADLYASKEIFEEVAQQHGILYYPKNGVKQKLGDCLNDAISEVKNQIDTKPKNKPEISGGQSFNYNQQLTPLPTKSKIFSVAKTVRI